MSQTKAQLLDGKSATIQFTGGSASAPSVSFTGDTNTGIYSPGADQVAISTSGTGRLFVDANGNVNIDSNTLYVDAINNRVGVGTATPSARLQVTGRLFISPFWKNSRQIFEFLIGVTDGKSFYKRFATFAKGTNII